jgi:hypothetical protein
MAANSTIVVAIPVIVFSVFGIIFGLLWLRRCLNSRHSFQSSSFTYDKVNHGLDEEEIEFKNMIEKGGTSSSVTSGDLDDDIFGDNKDDLKFDGKDMSNLSILDKFRSSLVDSASADIEAHFSDEGESDHEQIRL